jgi:hypothetical protein
MVVYFSSAAEVGRSLLLMGMWSKALINLHFSLGDLLQSALESTLADAVLKASKCMSLLFRKPVSIHANSALKYVINLRHRRPMQQEIS